MNFPNSSSTIKDAASCRVAKERYFWEYILATLPVIALNFGSCPVIILMNALVIIAIKTRRRIQSVYNILLACLAGTDLAVALVSQPLFIAQEIFFLSGASVEDYCHFYGKTVFFCLFPSIESLLILALLSMERYIAMKFSLRYASLMTTPRLTGAVLCTWIISVISVILRLIPMTYSFAVVFVYVTVIPAISIIVFCHTTVYLVSRRHVSRIRTEQLPSETKTKFVEERKALKTTSIINVFVFLSFVPSLLYGIFSRDIRQTNLRPLVLSCISLILLFTVGETKIYTKLWWNCLKWDKMKTNFKRRHCMFKRIFDSISYLLEALVCLCIDTHMRCFLCSLVNLP